MLYSFRTHKVVYGPNELDVSGVKTLLQWISLPWDVETLTGHRKTFNNLYQYIWQQFELPYPETVGSKQNIAQVCDLKMRLS